MYTFSTQSLWFRKREEPWGREWRMLISVWNIHTSKSVAISEFLFSLFQNNSWCKTFHMKMSFTDKFIFMQIKLIFIWMVSHLDSFWNRGKRKLGNGLFGSRIVPRVISYPDLLTLREREHLVKSVSWHHVIMCQECDTLHNCACSAYRISNLESSLLTALVSRPLVKGNEDTGCESDCSSPEPAILCWPYHQSPRPPRSDWLISREKWQRPKHFVTMFWTTGSRS